MRFTAAITILALVLVGCSMSVDPVTQKPQIVPSENTEKILKKIDGIAASIPALTLSVETALETPVGKLTPLPIRSILEIIGASISTLSLAYVNARKNMFKTGMAEIAYSNKIIVDENPDMKRKVKQAENAALNPKTIKLIQNEGLAII